MTNLTLNNWEFEADATNDRIIIRSLDTNEEYYLNEDGTTNVDANTLQGNAPSDLSAGITSTQHVTTFEEPFVSISGYDTVVDGNIDTNTAYVVSQASFSQSLDVSGTFAFVAGVAWNNDGTKVYLTDAGTTIYEYALTTAYDITTASLTDSIDISTNVSNARETSWNNDGTKFIVGDKDSSIIYEYNVSTAFDISTGAFNQSFDVSSESGNIQGTAWNNDGTKLYITANDINDLLEYDVSTAFDVSSATFSQSIDLSPVDTNIGGVEFNDDGSRLVIAGRETGEVHEYTLSTPFDVSTASIETSLDVSSESGNPIGIAWDGDGLSLYISEGGFVYQYDISQPTDPTSTVTVDYPDDVFEWDTATFESDPAVTVNLLDESGTTLLSDISGDTDISAISANENFQFELNFDTSSSKPSVDYLARRFVGGEDDSLKAESPVEISSSRAFDTNYTNDTGNPIRLSVVLNSQTSDAGFRKIFVDGTLVQQLSDTINNNERESMTALIPSGSTYTVEVQTASNYTIQSWVEQELTTN